MLIRFCNIWDFILFSHLPLTHIPKNLVRKNTHMYYRRRLTNIYFLNRRRSLNLARRRRNANIRRCETTWMMEVSVAPNVAWYWASCSYMIRVKEAKKVIKIVVEIMHMMKWWNKSDTPGNLTSEKEITEIDWKSLRRHRSEFISMGIHVCCVHRLEKVNPSLRHQELNWLNLCRIKMEWIWSSKGRMKF